MQPFLGKAAGLERLIMMHMSRNLRTLILAEKIICDVISTINKELANRASIVFNKLLSKDWQSIKISEIANVAYWQTDSSIENCNVRAVLRI